VKILNQDLFTTDISQATVVTLYLLPGTWSTWDQLFQFDIAARLQGD
jgi:hypothetical protein